MHRILAVVIISFFLLNIEAQRPQVLNYSTHDEKAMHFGFCMGLNDMDFIVKNSLNNYIKDSLIAGVTKPVIGFHIQIISNFRLGEYFDLRFLPGISFGERDLNFFRNNKVVNEKHKLESNFIEFPVLLKYKAKRLNNIRPYVVTGPNLRVDLGKTYSEDEEIYIDLKRFDLYHEVGVGIDFYMPYFKLGIELKYSYGFFDMLERRTTERPEYQNAIEKLNSSIFLLSFHFE